MFTMTHSPITTAVADLDLTKDEAILPLSPLGSDSYESYYTSPFDFHYGMPSRPVCIYHTGEPWPRPTGPEAYRVPKEARPIFTHPIAPVWRELGQEVYKYFDSIDLKWTTLDFVRFGEVEKEAGPPFIWVGVLPKTLSLEDAKNAAVHCKQILAKSQITDVEIAFRESVFTRSSGRGAGPQLLKYDTFFDPFNPSADVRDPFTPALGVPIAPKAFSHFDGTGGLYLREGGEHNRVLLLTARHVVLPPSEYRNEFYERKTNSLPRREVILLGHNAYQNALQSVTGKLEGENVTVDHHKNRLEDLGEAVEDEDAEISDEREWLNVKIAQARRLIGTLDKFYTEITRFWGIKKDRILGHVVHAPPISGGTSDKCFAEDWALIELCSGKIDWNSFKGNVMHLGARISPYDFMLKMHPDLDVHSFKIPLDGLLQLGDVVKEDELRHPTMLDATGVESVLVVKNGGTTGVTIGRATGLESFVREYDNKVIHSTSVMMAVHPYSQKDGAFSAPGDSGSVIADPNGRVVGILTGGAGKEDDYDVSYATPYYWLEERIKMAFPDSHLYPITA